MFGSSPMENLDPHRRRGQPPPGSEVGPDFGTGRNGDTSERIPASASGMNRHSLTSVNGVLQGECARSFELIMRFSLRMLKNGPRGALRNTGEEMAHKPRILRADDH
jgi:hypothetical protein